MIAPLAFLGHRRVAACVLACLCIVACGSDKDAADDSSAADTAAGSGAVADASSGKASEAVGGPGPWIDYGPAISAPAYPFNAGFAVPPPAPATDPDVAIERYAKECSTGADSAACRSLKLEVEGAFLEALLAVRASDEPVDPEWYRVAAAAETPQLACLGVNELAYLPGRTPQDEALIVKALDHPGPSVRAAALSSWQRIPAIEQVSKRYAPDRRGTSGTCLDGTRDYQPGRKWAGDYPGARFRAFASNDARRWFTSNDPLDKVIGWFANAGKPARTSQEMATDAAARFQQQMTEITASPDPGDEAKLMELMQGMASGGGQGNWDSEFRGMEGVGEVKYVMLSPTQALAIFQDDVFKATSIVAMRPAERPDMTPDMEKVTREAMARSILGY